MYALTETEINPRGRLEYVVAMWPTPATRDYKGANSSDHLENGTGRKHLDQLPNFVEHLWCTPSVAIATGGQTSRSGDRIGEELLAGQAQTLMEHWSTPRSSDGEKGGPNQSFTMGGIPLPAQAVNGQTPRVQSGAYQRDNGIKGKERLTVDGQASLFFRQVHPTYQVGGISSSERRSLNPLFVEWLMGWPPGWTLLGWTDFACSEMVLCHWRRLMLSALSRLPPPVQASQRQLSLFD